MTFSLATGNPVKILEMSSNYVRSVPRKFFKKIKKLWSGFEDLMKPRCLPTLFIDRARKKRNNNNNPFAWYEGHEKFPRVMSVWYAYDHLFSGGK